MAIEELASNIVPDWVDPDYGYDVNKPRKPNMRELSEAIGGKPLEDMTPEEYSSVTSQASSMLYGVVGSKTSSRTSHTRIVNINVYNVEQAKPIKVYEMKKIFIRDYRSIYVKTF